jgi:hypothetical protein
MDHAGVFHSSSFMLPDAAVGAMQALVLVIAVVGSFRIVLRTSNTTSHKSTKMAVQRLTICAMVACSTFAWLTFFYLFFRHKLETCIVRVRPSHGYARARTRANTLICLCCVQYWARWTCVIFYVVCKGEFPPRRAPRVQQLLTRGLAPAFIYALFIEKAYLANRFMYRVSRPEPKTRQVHACLLTCCTNQGPRLGNPLFRKLFVMWCLYLVLIVLLCIHAIAEYTPPRTANGTLPEPGASGNATLLEGHCSFYVEPPASVPLVVYDLVFTSTLVHWFVKPLLKATRHGREVSRKSRHETQIEATTRKSLRGALITLLASFLNCMSLALFSMVRRLFERMRAAMCCAANAERHHPTLTRPANDAQPFELCMTACTIDTCVSSVCADWMTTANYMQSFMSLSFYRNRSFRSRHSTNFKAGVSVEPSPAPNRTSGHHFHSTVVKAGVSPEPPPPVVPSTMVSEASSDTRPAS